MNGTLMACHVSSTEVGLLRLVVAGFPGSSLHGIVDWEEATEGCC